jgi:hypothetical protein
MRRPHGAVPGHILCTELRATMRASFVVVALATLVWPGCTPNPAPAPTAGPEPLGVVLVLHGSAFQAAATRDEAVRVVGEQTGRPVRTITEEPPVDRVIQSAADKLERSVSRTARAEARNAGCKKKGRAPATAVAQRAETILRVRLDAKTTSRRATDPERKELDASRLAGMLSAVGLGDDTLYETKLEGTVERVTFPGSPATAKQRVRWSGRRLGGKDAAPPPTVDEAMRKALAAMPKPAAPRWEVFARSLVSGGCPVLGAAVADTFLEGAAKRRVRAAAVAALGPAPTPAAPVDVAAVTPEVAPIEPAAEPVAPPAETAYSCSSLCTMHMVELCNNDRTLWSQNGARWENTRCGVRRSESFLESCYRMQWLSGAFEQSCVQPCESGDDGKVRLLAVLRRSGCIRAEG